MGALEDLMGQLGGEAGGGAAHAAMATAVLGMLSEQGSGGVEGLAHAFQNKGLGDVMASWISTGPNQAISPDQIHHAFGVDQIGQLAQRAGVSPEMAKALLVAVLPLLIDRLTPNGKAASQGSLLEGGLGMLVKKFL